MEKQQNSMATPALLRRFWPYMARYKGILCFDLFCAALTSVCELVLPLIMRSITNMGVNDLSSLTVSYILRVGALYLVLRLIDGVYQSKLEIFENACFVNGNYKGNPIALLSLF